ncbi:DUF309 domain-containing protein [Paenibacillus sp. CAU 1782]
MKDYPDAYCSYLIEFHATRDYFECHELLEEHWKNHPQDGYSAMWVGLIGVAVGQYHERRGNLRGAAKSYSHAMGRLREANLELLGLDTIKLIRQLEERSAAAEHALPYADMMLPLADRNLLERCVKTCVELGLEWGAPSPMGDEGLIHRHKLRDRSEVIAAREEALKQNRRNGKSE